MWSFICLDQNLPFTVSIVVVLFITLIEGACILVGIGLSHLIDNLFPSLDLDVDISGPHLDNTVFDKALLWLQIRQLPILIWIIIALSTFGWIGLILQGVLYSAIDWVLPGSIMSIISLIVSLPIVRKLSLSLAKILPKDESTAVSLDSLIGRIAVITLGSASHQNPSVAKVKDYFGYSHYILIEPDIKSEIFQNGQAVLIVKRAANIFYGIENQNELMIHSEKMAISIIK